MLASVCEHAHASESVVDDLIVCFCVCTYSIECVCYSMG